MGKLKVAPETVGGRTPLLKRIRRHGQGRLRQPGGGETKDHFTVGIQDDVSHASLDYDGRFLRRARELVRAMFYGLGADGHGGRTRIDQDHRREYRQLGQDTSSMTPRSPER